MRNYYTNLSCVNSGRFYTFIPFLADEKFKYFSLFMGFATLSSSGSENMAEDKKIEAKRVSDYEGHPMVKVGYKRLSLKVALAVLANAKTIHAIEKSVAAGEPAPVDGKLNFA